MWASRLTARFSLCFQWSGKEMLTFSGEEICPRSVPVITASLAWGKEFPCLFGFALIYFSTPWPHQVSLFAKATTDVKSNEGFLVLILNHPRGSNDTIHLSVHQDILFSLGCLELMPSEFSPASQVPPVQSFVVSSSSTSWWCAFLRFHSPLSDSAPFSQVIICTHMASALHLDCQPDLFTIF